MLTEFIVSDVEELTIIQDALESSRLATVERRNLWGSYVKMMKGSESVYQRAFEMDSHMLDILERLIGEIDAILKHNPDGDKA